VADTPRMHAPRIRVGTSGFSYTEWRGAFYPEKLPAKQYLSFYGQHFETTEINASFYRIPRRTTTEGWYAEVPAGFAFTLKLSQRITHIKRLRDVDQEMTWFMDAALGLQDKLGSILVQLPPNFKADIERLDAFLVRHARHARLAVEFRHPSWYADEVYEALRRHGAALAVVEMEDGDDVPRPREVTADFVYVRLRKGDYTADELRDWATWLRAQSGDVFCYLKHDERAPELALALLRALAGISTEA